MFEYFYNEILRKTVIGFGSLFNGIEIKRTDNSGKVTSVLKVPLAYGPTQKFLARLNEQPDLNKPVQMTLPRMSFEFNGLNYDPSRKVTTTQTFLSKSLDNPKEVKKTYMPVPYNMSFDLNIMCKLNDDMLQIIEQILPYFQPSYNLTVNLVDTIGEQRDIPIVLDTIAMQDDYEGDFTTRRALIYTLKFTAKTYLFGPVKSADKDIIKKVTLGVVSGEANSTLRDLSYSTTPVATKNYTDIVVTTLQNDVQITDTIIEVNNSTNIIENSFIIINEETMKVTEKSGNMLSVSRGSYNTPISIHVSGSEIRSITTQDNNLIEFGDDFGFSSEWS